ncbi:MAG: Na(+)-translocating NADH-quinone reductase subunit C [Candidatus Hydrogenedentes bacterium]|nr:Na(+)-translocating NADH-quinone reductase subunit C [Candidatus Hydrogenedentota bacterium]
MQYSTKYIFLFAAAICLVCSLLIAIPAVALRARQEENRQLDQKKAVIMAARLVKPEERLDRDKVAEVFKNIEAHVVDLATGDTIDMNPDEYDFNDVEKSMLEESPIQVQEIPKKVKVYHVRKEGKVDMIVLPIFGKGLWSTLWGFFALDVDTTTVEGITYYQHGETPGLGGEVDNPKWKSRWPGRKAFDESWNVEIDVIKGAAGPPASDPHRVDGLSGATITGRGVARMLQFWLGDQGFGPYLKKFREQSARSQ